jgi:ABC-type enterochelin transport system permease subunit
VVGLSVALAVAGFAVVRRLLPMELRETHNANTAVIFGALYVMYGLVVGFSAYFVSYQYDNAQRIAEAEASSVQELHRLAEGFPEVERRELQGG